MAAKKRYYSLCRLMDLMLISFAERERAGKCDDCISTARIHFYPKLEKLFGERIIVCRIAFPYQGKVLARDLGRVESTYIDTICSADLNQHACVWLRMPRFPRLNRLMRAP